MKITIITDTCREGYIVTQALVLAQQTFRDFEWILMDDIKNERKPISEDLARASNLIHIKPKIINPYFSTVPCLNEALTYARGELIFFMVDYVVPNPGCLERHWELHKKYPDAFLSGLAMETSLTPEQLQLNQNITVSDYRMGLFNNSIFKRKWIDNESFEVFMDGAQNWWAGRNDSAPLQDILDCNGFDLELDGRHGYQDSDLGQRLMIKGLRYIIDTQCSCLEFPHVRVEKPAVRDEVEHMALASNLFLKRYRDKIYKVNPDLNLREEWQKYQSLR